MEGWWYVIAVVIVLPLLWWLIQGRGNKRGKLPLRKSGWLPWLGVAIEFGKAPLHYIYQAHKELGDIFTVHAAGRKMTFLFDYHDSSIFFYSQFSSFQDAVQNFTISTANISVDSFYKHHSKIHDLFKGKLTSNHLPPFCSALSKSFHYYIHKTLEENGEEMELIDFVRNSMFPVVFRQLFGDSNLQLSEKTIKEVQKRFAHYDVNFEYAQLPAILNREWCNNKQWLLTIIQNAVTRILQRNESPQKLVEHIVAAVDIPNAAGYSLLVLWASQANAIPITFWTLAFILSHPKVFESIKEELQDWSLTDKGREFTEVTEAHLKDAPPSIKRALMEAIRLRSPGMITRRATKSLQVKEYTIPAGHYLMMSPYWSHRDPQYFPDPETFNPDRWLDCDLEKGQFLPGFIGFGGGRYQCPGRWFALMEINLYLVMVLKMVDLSLLSPVPPPSPLHLVGSQQPQGQCRVKIKIKK